MARVEEKDVNLKVVEIDSTNKAGKLPVYEGAGAAADAPGVVVIEEWWGINQQIKEEAAHYAKQGFHVVVPDLYRGKQAHDREQAGHLMGGLDWKGAVEDISAATQYLKAKGAKKIGIVGYCMGGALSLAGSILVPGLTCGVVFYGICSKDLADPTKCKIPILGHFGEKDEHVGFADVASAKALEANLKTAGVTNEIHVYPGAGHAFTNRYNNPPSYHEESYKKATERTVAWFKKYLA